MSFDDQLYEYNHTNGHKEFTAKITKAKVLNISNQNSKNNKLSRRLQTTITIKVLQNIVFNFAILDMQM